MLGVYISASARGQHFAHPRFVWLAYCINKTNFESKFPEQNGKLGGTPGPRPKNGTVPAKMERTAIL